MPEEAYRYCPRCGAELETGKIEGGKSRRHCPECDWVHYLNPIPVAVGVAYNSSDQILLVKRNLEPARGEWSLPGGFMEIGESPRQACLRELAEETSLAARVEDLLGLYNHQSDFYGGLLIIAYALAVTGGDLEVDPREVQSARFVPPEDPPEIPFPSHRDAIERFVNGNQAKTIEE